MKQSASFQGNNIHGVGRRKSSVARVWLKPGRGVITVNGKNYEEYFTTDVSRTTVASPLKLAGKDRSVDVDINVDGGGVTGQAGAVMLGIARALVNLDETLKAVMKTQNMLTVDSRVKERKKYGQLGARRKFQFVKR